MLSRTHLAKKDYCTVKAIRKMTIGMGPPSQLSLKLIYCKHVKWGTTSFVADTEIRRYNENSKVLTKIITVAYRKSTINRN